MILSPDDGHGPDGESGVMTGDAEIGVRMRDVESGVTLLYGGLEPEIVHEIWNRADAGQRRHIIWDMPMSERLEIILARVGNPRNISATAWLGGEPVAIAWACRLLPRTWARTCECHFMFCKRLGRLHYLACGKLFLELLKNEGLDMAVCLIPQKLRGARRFAADLKFTERLVMPSACLCNGQYMDAGIWAREL